MNIRVGNNIMCEGPYGKIKYQGSGEFEYLGNKLSKKNSLGLIGGGTGVTPLFSIAQSSCLAKDGLIINMLYSSKTKDDILIIDQLNEL